MATFCSGRVQPLIEIGKSDWLIVRSAFSGFYMVTAHREMLSIRAAGIDPCEASNVAREKVIEHELWSDRTNNMNHRVHMHHDGDNSERMFT